MRSPPRSCSSLRIGIRHARARPTVPAARRAFAEHVEATGAFYGRARALGHALAAYGRLSIGWGNVTLIENVTFDVGRGEVFAILEGSGSGKSTLLRSLVGLEVPERGGIDFIGHGASCLRGGACSPRSTLCEARPAFQRALRAQMAAFEAA
jgi:ABC-type glutathione transport system ATPase component